MIEAAVFFLRRHALATALSAIAVFGMAAWSGYGRVAADREAALPVLVHERSVAVDGAAGNANLPPIDFSSSVSEGYACDASGDCVRTEKPRLLDAVAETLGLRVPKSLGANAQSALTVGGDASEQGYPAIGPYNEKRDGSFIAYEPATWRYKFSPTEGGSYVAYVTSRNVGSADLTRGPACANEADPNEACVPKRFRSHVFSGMKLLECAVADCSSVTVVRSFPDIAVPATPASQGWSANLGSVEPKKTYLLEFSWANDFSKDIAVEGQNARYDANVELQRILFSRPAADTTVNKQGSADVIGVRAYSNPGYDSLSSWYKKYAPNPGNPQATTINGFPALIDGKTTYVMGFNLVDRSVVDSWGLKKPIPAAGSTAGQTNDGNSSY